MKKNMAAIVAIIDELPSLIAEFFLRNMAAILSPANNAGGREKIKRKWPRRENHIIMKISRGSGGRKNDDKYAVA